MGFRACHCVCLCRYHCPDKLCFCRVAYSQAAARCAPLQGLELYKRQYRDVDGADEPVRIIVSAAYLSTDSAWLKCVPGRTVASAFGADYADLPAYRRNTG